MMATLLFECRADVEGANREGWTPLRHVVVASNDIELAEELLQHGAKPNKADNSGVTPLLLTEKIVQLKRYQEPSWVPYIKYLFLLIFNIRGT